MNKKIVRFAIFAVIFFFAGIFIWKKINHKSSGEILQEKAEQFYENQENFEKVIAYISELDYRSITENNEIRTDVIVDGITFRLSEWESEYILSLYPAKILLSQLLNNDERAAIIDIIGESRISIYYDKNYNNTSVVFSIEDVGLEHEMTRLVWHNSDYEPSGDWIYQLNDNWMIISLGVCP